MSMCIKRLACSNAPNCYKPIETVRVALRRRLVNIFNENCVNLQRKNRGWAKGHLRADGSRYSNWYPWSSQVLSSQRQRQYTFCCFFVTCSHWKCQETANTFALWWMAINVREKKKSVNWFLVSNFNFAHEMEFTLNLRCNWQVNISTFVSFCP